MKSGFLSRHFPPPKYLNPPKVGISFSDRSIKAISWGGVPQSPKLNSVLVPLETGTIVSGSVADMGALVAKLSKVRESFDTPFAFFAVPDEFSYVFTASVPVPAKGGDMKESVAFIMEENVPLPISDVIFDFLPVKIVPSDSDTEAFVVVAACVRREVEKFAEALHKSGFEPVGCIHESEAIAKAVVKDKTKGPLCIIHARENRIGIHLAKRNTIYFSTIRNTTTKSFKKDLLDEFDKFLEYCEKYGAGQGGCPKSILVCGEFEDAKESVEALATHDKSPKDIKLSNVWSNVFDIDRHIPEIPYEQSLSFAGAIGAALLDII